jgi:hypothetical protein
MTAVIPAKAGIIVRPDVGQSLDWIPASAGMTVLLDGLRWQCLEFALEVLFDQHNHNDPPLLGVFATPSGAAAFAI